MTNETLTEILSTMRSFGEKCVHRPFSWQMVDGLFKLLADKIEEAVKQEYGNVAALREALKMFVNNASCLNHCDIHRFHPNTTECDGIMADNSKCPMKPECDAVFAGRIALAKPSRNCDRPECKTRDGAYNTWYCETWKMSRDDAPDWIDWLFAKVEVKEETK